MQWAINGGIFPRVPMFMVERGDLVKVTIVNGSSAVHPMHLHGHHMLVLSREREAGDGQPVVERHAQRRVRRDATRSPSAPTTRASGWTTATTSRHAAAGLTMHVAYAGVTTPYVTGGAAHNHPE